MTKYTLISYLNLISRQGRTSINQISCGENASLKYIIKQNKIVIKRNVWKTFLLLFSRSVMSSFLQPHGLQDSRLPCPPLPLRVCSNYTRLIETLEKAMTPHSSTLAWKIPRMEESGRLQSMGSLRVRHN